MLCVIMKMMDPLSPNLIRSLAIITHSNPLVVWKASLIPLCLMILSSKDDEW
jgi:hypothetical protein